MPQTRKRWVAKIWYSSKNQSQVKSNQDLSNELAAEGLWPTTLNHECFKAACILRSVSNGETYKDALRHRSSESLPAQKRGTNVDPKVIRQAKGLVICSILRAGLWENGAGGSGVAIVRQADDSWSFPAAVRVSTPEIGAMVGVDIYDMVLVLNTQESVDAVTRGRCIVGGDHYAVPGPLSVGWFLETDERSRKAPIWAYLRYNRYYAEAPLEHTAIYERAEENESYYSPQKLGIHDILTGKVRSPPDGIKGLMETVRLAQGEENVDTKTVPTKKPPSDFRVVEEGHAFGVPDPEDPDPYGLMALQNQGIATREAKTGKVASPETFEFSPRFESPVHDKYYSRARGENGSVVSGRTSWRKSSNLASLDVVALSSPGTGPVSPDLSSIGASSPRMSLQSQRTGQIGGGRTPPESPGLINGFTNFSPQSPAKTPVHSLSSPGGSENSKTTQSYLHPRQGSTRSINDDGSESIICRQNSLVASLSNVPSRIPEESEPVSHDRAQDQVEPPLLPKSDASEEFPPEPDSMGEMAPAEVDPGPKITEHVDPGVTQPDASAQEGSSSNRVHSDHVKNIKEPGVGAMQDDVSEPGSELASDDDFEDLDDGDEQVEVFDASTHTQASTLFFDGAKVTSVNKPKVVSVAKALAPAVPSRNPSRVVHSPQIVGSEISQNLDEDQPDRGAGNTDNIKPGEHDSTIDATEDLDAQANLDIVPSADDGAQVAGPSAPDRLDDAPDQNKASKATIEGPKMSNMLASMRKSYDESDED